VRTKHELRGETRIGVVTREGRLKESVAGRKGIQSGPKTWYGPREARGRQHRDQKNPNQFLSRGSSSPIRSTISQFPRIGGCRRGVKSLKKKVLLAIAGIRERTQQRLRTTATQGSWKLGKVVICASGTRRESG